VRIGDKEVDDVLLMNYNQTIRNIMMAGRLGKLEWIEALEKKRQEIHNAILTSVGEERASKFENELFNYREKIYNEILEERR